MLSIYLAALDTEEERQKMTELYEAHRYTLLMVALKVTKNQTMAEDALHNTFLSVIKHKEEMFALSSRDFLRKNVIIVKNKCIDLLRKAKRDSFFALDEYDLPSDDQPVDVQVINRGDYETMIKTINGLDDLSRQVLLLKYVEGHSYKEIAETLSMTSKEVDNRIFLAK